MKISIYELLGMIKDNKAPKRIKYKDAIYEYYEEDDVIDYRIYNENIELYSYLSFVINNDSFKCLNDKVEILEEDKKIEKLKKEKIISGMLDNEIQYIEGYKLEDVGDKINEIIDKINEVE